MAASGKLAGFIGLGCMVLGNSLQRPLSPENQRVLLDRKGEIFQYKISPLLHREVASGSSRMAGKGVSNHPFTLG